jgi:flagellin
MSGTNIGFNPIADLSRITVAKMSRQSAKHRLALSSGKKINTISDDASGFSLARGLEANRRGLAKALGSIGNALVTLARAMQKAGEYFLRLEAKEKSIQLTKTSVEGIRSQIEDTDFAQDQMASQRMQVLMEMGFTSLKDAIAAPQQVLSLFA